MSLLNSQWLSDTFDIGTVLDIESGGMGQSNRLGILRVQTTNGVYAVKQYEQAPSQVALDIEYTAFSTGFPLPEPILTRDSAYVGMSVQETQSTWVHVYRWIDGVPLAWNTVDPVLSHHMGCYLAMMHTIQVASTVLSAKRWEPLHRARWDELAGKAVERQISWSAVLSDRLNTLVAWEDLILANTVDDEPVVPSQRDLHPPNIIYQQDDTYVVIDWDGAGPVNAREEAAMFALVWATTEAGRPSRDAVHAFIRGYRDAGCQFRTRGIADLMHRERSRLWWIAHNVRRDISAAPGPHQWLTPALLSKVREPNVSELHEMASLFDDDRSA